jgi:predicted nucleic acid-binding protein
MWDQFVLLPIEAQPSPTPEQSKAILNLSHKHVLTAYDAAYLELAMRKQLQLATLDGDLRRAAMSENIILL